MTKGTLRTNSNNIILVHLKETTSTMEYFTDYFNIRPNEVAVIIAEKQSSGRGRRGRIWVSEEGGLYMTIVKEPRKQALSLYQAMASIAVLEAVRKLYGVELRIKWPNDIYTKDLKRKVGGVLVNIQERGNDVRIGIGIGVNVNNKPPSSLEVDAASLLYLTNKKIDPIILGYNIYEELLLIENLEKSKILEMYRKLSALQGVEVEVLDLSKIVKILDVDETLKLIVLDVDTNTVFSLSEATIRVRNAE